jgi:hypothetical protein
MATADDGFTQPIFGSPRVHDRGMCGSQSIGLVVVDLYQQISAAGVPLTTPLSPSTKLWSSFIMQ